MPMQKDPKATVGATTSILFASILAVTCRALAQEASKPTSAPESSAALSSDYLSGQTAARQDIALGKPRRAFTGLPSGDGLDPKTGLLLMGLGCRSGAGTMAWMDGYNSTIDAALAAGKLDRYVLKYKVTTYEVLERRFRSEKPFELAGGSPPVDGPSGLFRIEIAPRFGNPTDQHFLFATDLRSQQRDELWFVGARAHVIFDHDGTTLLVRDDSFRHYFTIDLPSVRVLQIFSDEREQLRKKQEQWKREHAEKQTVPEKPDKKD